MEVIVKKGHRRIDPKHPASTDRDYAGAALAGQRRLPKIKFENDAQRRDYVRTVEGNPGNVMGLPAFFPPLKIRVFGGMSRNCSKQGHRPRKCADGSFCLDCGKDLD